MKDIAIFGAGGFGKEVACLLHEINSEKPTWNLIGCFDDGKIKGEYISHVGTVLGGLSDINEYREELSLVIAIGNPNIVKKIVSQIHNPNISFPNIFHPNVFFADKESFNIGIGNIIQRNCAFSCDVTIGDFNILNGSIVFGHDDKIGNFNCFMPAIRVSGEVFIGECNFFGVGSIILQQIKIGNNVRLGAGSVLMTKPRDGNLYMGNPAKKTVF